MATVGRGIYAEAVHRFFDNLVQGDLEKALHTVADDADMESPWNEGTVTGKEAIEAALAPLFATAESRPSFTMMDIGGDGHTVHLKVSMSRRFGAAAEHHKITLLHLQGVIHHIRWTAE